MRVLQPLRTLTDKSLLLSAGDAYLEWDLFRQGLEEDPLAVQIAYVHVLGLLVSPGDTVRAGRPVARIGKNGSSFHPHVHIGAFRGEMMSGNAVPLQIRMNLAAMGRLRGTTPR